MYINISSFKIILIHSRTIFYYIVTIKKIRTIFINMGLLLLGHVFELSPIFPTSNQKKFKIIKFYDTTHE